jgi:NADH:ubiquinone oxidoreductase subunit F (NADH-binding)
MSPAVDRVIRRSVGSAAVALPAAPGGAGRLLLGFDSGAAHASLARHSDQWGPLPVWRPAQFIDELDHSGLRGHGGAWFPVATKWRSIQAAGRKRPVVVANGAEGEPASGKDALLIRYRPHLILDGAAVAATTLGATRIVVHVPSGSAESMASAVAERRRRTLDPCPVEVVVAPDRFLAGQEAAVVNTINGRNVGIPSFQGLRPVRERGVDGRPTLVQNVETFAHIALIARFGQDWFRSVGTPGSPGTALLTVTGRWTTPRIIEAPLGTTLGHLLGLNREEMASLQGVLFGGYGGGWVAPDEAVSTPLTEEALRSLGSTMGAGVVVWLPRGPCPLAEGARIVRYLQGEGAGQCGPCVNGLAELATAVEQLAVQPRALPGGLSRIEELCSLIEGRGACHHPDGAARYVRTMLRTFRSHVGVHLRQGPCPPAPPFLPVPAPRRHR